MRCTLLFIFLISTSAFAQIRSGGGPDQSSKLEDILLLETFIKKELKLLREYFIEKDKACGGKLNIAKDEEIYSIELKLTGLLSENHSNTACDQECNSQSYADCLQGKKCVDILTKLDEATKSLDLLLNKTSRFSTLLQETAPGKVAQYNHHFFYRVCSPTEQ